MGGEYSEILLVVFPECLVAPPGFFIGRTKQDWDLRRSPGFFSWTTPSTFAVNATKGPFLDWHIKMNESVK